jgi:UDP-glucose 4-epimerase
MKFLVIGGAGYVGSHFVAEAMRQGHQCFVLDNLSTGHQLAVDGCTEFIKSDIRRQVAFAEIVDRINPDVVMHYAGSSLVAESTIDPKKYYDNNVLGTKSIIEVLSRSKTSPALIFSSTCAVYGNPGAGPLHEDLSRQPISPYGRSKLVCEFMIEDFCQAYGQKAFCLRYFNAAGADATKPIGESHDPETHLIPIILQRSKSGETLEIFGQDYGTADGTCIRDYIHVTDLAEYHLRAAKYLTSREPGFCDALNLGSGSGFSNLQIVEAAKGITRKQLQIRFVDRRPGDPPTLFADTGKAVRMLEYSPKHSSLETILATAWKWQLNPRY